MPRLPRPSRRLLLTASLLLLAGAVVNVAVAWVLVGAPDSWTPGGKRMIIPESGPDGGISTAALPGVASGLGGDGADPYIAVIYRGLGWRVVLAGFYQQGATDGGEKWLERCAETGWPAFSMMVKGKSPEPGVWNDSPAIQPRQGLLPSAYWFPSERPRIPLTPLPAGFAINTLFYTAVLALPLSFFPVRRHIRARRGRCPKCGYDRAGLTDPAAPCPECGAAASIEED